jgi:hypothetical protein
MKTIGIGCLSLEDHFQDDLLNNSRAMQTEEMITVSIINFCRLTTQETLLRSGRDPCDISKI